MSGKVNFIEVDSEEPCGYCGRKKLSKREKFYEVFVGDKDFGMVICELCKGGFLTRFLEGSEKTHVTHLIFYAKRSLCELEEKLPKEITQGLNSAIENYEAGEYSVSFRSIGFAAEWLTGFCLIKVHGLSFRYNRI